MFLPGQVVISRKCETQLKILKRLEKGGFATIFLVEVLSGPIEQGQYALKVHEPTKPRSHWILERDFYRNTQSIDRLTEVIPRYYGELVIDDEIGCCYDCLLIEYIRGGDLWDKIEYYEDCPVDMQALSEQKKQKRPLSENKIQHYFTQLVLAVKVIHGIGYAIGDLKPENVLVDEDDKIRICDFGHSYRSNEGSDDSECDEAILACWGTAGYHSPELVTGNGLPWHQFDNKSSQLAILPSKNHDIWCIGIILIEMAGQYPFTIKNQVTGAPDYLQVKECRFSLDKRLKQRRSRELQHLIKSILVPIQDRPTLEDIIEHPWMGLIL